MISGHFKSYTRNSQYSYLERHSDTLHLALWTKNSLPTHFILYTHITARLKIHSEKYGSNIMDS
jgi:hypothetical protein